MLRSQALTTLVVTHDLPYALELCPRSVILDEGRIVADGPTADLLADRALLAAHRLELPFGFDPAGVAPTPSSRSSTSLPTGIDHRRASTRAGPVRRR